MKVSDIVSILAVLVSLGTLLVVWRKMPHETREMDARADGQDAETAGKYLDIADRAAERALKLEKRVTELEAEVAELKALNENLLNDRDDLKDWAERLVHQVKSLGLDPVKLRVASER